VKTFSTPSKDLACLFSFQDRLYLRKWDYNVYDYLYSISDAGSKVDSIQLSYSTRDILIAGINDQLYALQRYAYLIYPTPGFLYTMDLSYKLKSVIRFPSAATDDMMRYHPEIIKSDGQNIWVYDKFNSFFYKLILIDKS
jgi:hypothetical protein